MYAEYAALSVPHAVRASARASDKLLRKRTPARWSSSAVCLHGASVLDFGTGCCDSQTSLLTHSQYSQFSSRANTRIGAGTKPSVLTAGGKVHRACTHHRVRCHQVPEMYVSVTLVTQRDADFHGTRSR